MKIAAIDIGSNAIRFQVSSVLEKNDRVMFKKLEYVRFPLRLGHDVFTTNIISKKSVDKFLKLMLTYKLLIELYEVNYWMVCATSAFRESKNGAQLVKEVKEQLGIKIFVIDGHREASLINKSLTSFLEDKTYLHIDVGGGSTELNLLKNRVKICSQSFKIGSVRMLEKNDLPEIWKRMERWVEKNVTSDLGGVISIGTGGNIGKVFELAKKKQGKAISLKKIIEIKKMLEGLTIDERVYDLHMNEDRADVIIPAVNIYIKVMQWAHSKEIIVPEVGLKDGILLHLYEKIAKGKEIEFINTQDLSDGKKLTAVR